MKTNVINVKESKTYQVFTNLVNLGFDASISSMFAHSYDKDNRYLSISVKNAETRLPELWNVADGLEIILSKYVNEDNTRFELRKEREFAEFISENVWMDYYNSVK
jgi:hypothetical protein